MNGPLVASIVIALAIVVLLWRLHLGITARLIGLAVRIVQTVGRSPTLARRAVRWARRRTGHATAVAAATWSKPASLWRRRSERTRRIGRRTLSPVRIVTTPVRAVVRRVYRRLTGFERFVGGSDPVIAALACPAAGRFAPPLRTAYAERLDAMARSFVIGENRGAEVTTEREWLLKVIKYREKCVDGAIDAARQQATALVSASEGLIDAVGGLIIPCCERAMARFLGVPDTEGPPLFAAGQLLLHRVFLNPASPAGISDWYAERAARESTKAFLEVLEREVQSKRDPHQWYKPLDVFAPVTGAPAGSDRASDPIMLATALGPHVAWVTPHVLDELLRHRSELGRQNPWNRPFPTVDDDRDVAREPNGPTSVPLTADRRARLILEAMRHSPAVAGLIRECPHATDLTDHGVKDPQQGGTAKQPVRLRPLREGVTYVYTRAAEFDPARRGYGRPNILAFAPDRFKTNGTAEPVPPTMSFGHGMHACLGRDIALRLIVAILDPLLSQDGVSRDPTSRGLLQHRLRRYSPLNASGPWRFPTHLYVRFEAGIPA